MSKHDKHNKKQNTDNVEKEPQTKGCSPAQEELQAELLAEKAALEELKAKFLSLAAEYDNFRKRSAKEKEQIYPEAVAHAVGQFLAVADGVNAAMALQIKDPECKKGIELISNSITAALSSLKVVEFGEPGDKFDPQKHNAVIHIQDDNFGECEVIEVLQKGYALGEKIIRHAMVKVAN